MNTTRTMIAAAIALAAANANAEWVASGHVAIANQNAPVVVGITFDYSQNCDAAQLLVYGNAEVTVMGLVVDGTNYGSVEAYDAGDGLMMASAGPAALRAIKHGTTAAVLTDQGTLVLSLDGSAAAMNAAYVGCLAEANEAIEHILRPLGRSVPPMQPDASDSVSF